MKQGWEIKKLGEVATIVGGSTPKTNDFANWGGSNYWVTPAELTGNKWISSTERTITDLGVKNAHLQILPVGTVLLSSRAPIGKVAITTVEMYCNQGFKNIVCSKNILNEFVYWFLFHNTDYLNSLGTGATFKEISKRVVEQIPIPVPERAEQERIVGELDCLSGIIAAKRAQLRELDTLAQSIFYTMFGDPITNDKGWQTKKWGDLLTIVNGKNQKKVICENGKYPIYGSGGIMGWANDYLCPQNTVIIGRKGNINKPLFVKEKFWNVDTAFGLVANKEILIPYFLFFFCQMYNFEQHNKAVTIPSLTKSDLLNIQMPCPDINLQTQFAEKIEQIEEQKQLIKASIIETEDLFNSRMSYYFD